MSVTITVDLATSTPKDIARAAKFMLEFAGYQDPSVGAAQEAHNAAADADDRACGAGIPDSYTSDTTHRRAAIQGMQGQLKHPMGSLGEEVSDDNGPLPDSYTYRPGTIGQQMAQTLTPETAFAAGVGGNLSVPTSLPPVAEPKVAPPVLDVTTTLPPPPPGIEVDAQGVPWDNRIHSGSRAKIGDGTWRQKRNLDPEVFKKVMDELRHTMGVERRAPQPPAPPAPQEVFAPHPPVPPAAVDVSAMLEVPPPPFAGNAVPPAPPISTTPPVPASAGAAPAASPGSKAPTFPDLMKKITAGFAAKTITQMDIARAVNKVGLTALPMLASRPDLVGEVATELGVAL